VSNSDPDDVLTEVPVQAAVLRATAGLLELLGDFFTDTDPTVRTKLGTYLICRYGEENTTDGITEAVVMLGELSDAAELLHALAGDYHPDNVATPDQQ
jgi:hypothetical protein